MGLSRALYPSATAKIKCAPLTKLGHHGAPWGTMGHHWASFQVAVDTGTSMLAGPSRVIHELTRQGPSRWQLLAAQWALAGDCKWHPTAPTTRFYSAYDLRRQRVGFAVARHVGVPEEKAQVQPCGGCAWLEDQ
eukprot:Skav207390  [mRNA]  locus=scaffold2421:78060:81049:+ [translate_table: standard]